MKRIKPKVDLSTLPRVVAELTGNRENGPNCWNATILFFDKQSKRKYISDWEMEEWLYKNTNIDEYRLCRKGTILVMSSAEYDLLHTAVFIGPGILWHKRGCEGPWEIVTEKQIFKIYPETTKWHYRTIKENFAPAVEYPDYRLDNESETV